jgi:hypothetical protein
LGISLSERRFSYLQGVSLWRIFRISKLFQTQTILILVSRKLVLKKKIQEIPIGRFESLCFVVLVKL